MHINRSVDFDTKFWFGGTITATTNLTIGERLIFKFGEYIDNLVDGWLRITGGLNVTESAVIGKDLDVTGNFYW